MRERGYLFWKRWIFRSASIALLLGMERGTKPCAESLRETKTAPKVSNA
jgi:hypothetical protein